VALIPTATRVLEAGFLVKKKTEANEYSTVEQNLSNPRNAIQRYRLTSSE